MSSSRSKSSNKKLNKKTTLKSIHINSQTDSVLSEQPVRKSINDKMIIPSAEPWRSTKHQQQTTPTQNENNFTGRRSLKILRPVSSSTPLIKRDSQHQETLSTATSETSVRWEQILDREFRSLDIDEDGYVSMADLQSVLNTRAMSVCLRQSSRLFLVFAALHKENFSHICNSNEIILRIFEELDLNHDQRISKQEFKLYKNTRLDREKRFHRSTFEETLGTIFALFDRNHDNYISPHEIRETMTNLGETIDDNIIEEMMQTADTNRDGRISRDEFKKLLIQLKAQKKM